MSNNFAEYINRIGTDSVKWDSFEERYPGLDSKDCIPMWVADTDFKVPQEVIDAIVEKAKFGIFGYPKAKGDSFLYINSRKNLFVQILRMIVKGKLPQS